MICEIFLLKFGTSMEMTQKPLEEQFADLLIQLSFIFQDLVITMSFSVQTQFSNKTCSLAEKKKKWKIILEEKNTERNLIDFFVTSEKINMCPYFLPQHTFPIREKRPIQF